jgi:hypothetical protein
MIVCSGKRVPELYQPECESRDSSVGIVLSYGLDDWRSRVRFPAGVGNFSLHHRVQNSSGAHPDSYPMGKRGSFPGVKAAGSWSWPLTQYAFVAWCLIKAQGKLYFISVSEFSVSSGCLSCVELYICPIRSKKYSQVLNHRSGAWNSADIPGRSQSFSFTVVAASPFTPYDRSCYIASPR